MELPATTRALRGQRFAPLVAGVWLLAALTGGCHGNQPATAPVTLSVWFHSGQPAERRTLQRQAAAFNAHHTDVQVALTMLPEGAYNGQLQAAAVAGDLPDVLEFDGPYVYQYAWEGRLRPLGGLLPSSLRQQLLPSILAQGTYRGRWYSVGTFDSGLGLWADRRKLVAARVRIPTSPADAWSASEFDRVLAALAGRDPDGEVLDLKLNYPNEWLTYAFSPLLESAGGDLINRKTYASADGWLNGPKAIAAMRRIQDWFRRGYVDPNLDDAAFVSGRVALSWGGHWNYPRYHAALGKNLVLLPLPRFGLRLVTGQGSWNWGITARCAHPHLAAEFLEFLLQPKQILAITHANGGVPATRAAVARSPLYRPGGALHLFAAQLAGGYAMPRPRTPAYPVISSAFAAAFRDIRDGADVRRALERATTAIDRDIRDNHGYPDLDAAGTKSRRGN